MDLTAIYNQMAALVVIIFIGFCSTKLRIVNDAVSDSLSTIVMNITFPALLLTSMDQEYSAELFNNSMCLIAISLFVYVLLIVLAWLLGKGLKVPRDQLGVLKFMLVLGNVCFMGFPIIGAIYGKVGIFYAASFNLIYNLLFWTYGVIIFNEAQWRQSLGRLINPGLIALFIGYLLFLTPLELPNFLFTPLEWVGEMTIPLALLLVGNSLFKIKLKELFTSKELWALSWIRLIVFPLLLLFFLRLLQLNSYLLVVPVTLIATPAALLTGVFAKTYGGDEILASKGVVLTNLLSIVTIPFIVYLITFFQN